MTDIVDRLNDSLSAGYSELRKEAAAEITRLRAKIEEMERQEPVAWARKLGLDVPSFGCVTDLKYRPSDPVPFVAPCSATDCLPELERFAALVAATERTACARHFDVAMRNAVTAEREACAEIADEYEHQLVAGSCARDIRARGDA